MLSRFILFLGLVAIWMLLMQFFHPLIGGALGLGITALWFWINLYPDKWLLHYLQAREIIENDHPEAYRKASTQAHKFKMYQIKIYSYSGFFQRTFSLSAGNRLTFVVEKEILEKASPEEIEALFFSLALKASQGVARQHTLALLITSIVWLLPLSLSKRKRVRVNWFIQYFIAPIDAFLTRILMPHYKWQNFLKVLKSYQWENSRLEELSTKLSQPKLNLSISRYLSYRFFSANHSSSQQMILAIEGATHPFDLMGRAE
jgi:hypothetical protein